MSVIPPPTASRLYIAVAGIGAVVIFATGAFVILGDWLAGWHLTRPWAQLSAAFAGVMLLVTIVHVPAISRPRRIVLCAAGILLIAAVLDSLDGQQDVLTLVVVALIIWMLSFANITAQLVATGPPTTLRRWLAVTLGVLATFVYLGAAGYYVIMNLTMAPVKIDLQALAVIGFMLAAGLRWIGEIKPDSVLLTGAVRVCPSCGLRNIRERTTCKHCGTQLGPVEHVT